VDTEADAGVGVDAGAGVGVGAGASVGVGVGGSVGTAKGNVGTVACRAEVRGGDAEVTVDGKTGFTSCSGFGGRDGLNKGIRGDRGVVGVFIKLRGAVGGDRGLFRGGRC